MLKAEILSVDATSQLFAGQATTQAVARQVKALGVQH
jgi:hypothetical protein